MLEISLITVIYKRIGKFWCITQRDLTAMNGHFFIKNLHGVPLHLSTYAYKYPTAKYLIRLFRVDIA